MATNRKSAWETESLITLPRYRSKPEFLNLGAIDIWVVGSRVVRFRMFKLQSCSCPLDVSSTLQLWQMNLTPEIAKPNFFFLFAFRGKSLLFSLPHSWESCNTVLYIPNLFELVFTAQAARDRRWTLGRRGKVEIRSQKVKGGTGVQEVAQVKELISRAVSEKAYSFKHRLQSRGGWVWLGTRSRAMDTGWGWEVQAGACCRVEALSSCAVPVLAASGEWRHWRPGWSPRKWILWWCVDLDWGTYNSSEWPELRFGLI